ncbi:MAG: ATP-binding protein, partial [Victivallales bacterium]|nr:ATP-binding protein [Victivallales bacterium]
LRSECQRMGELIDDMLNLSRVGRTEIKPDKVDLSAVANRIVTRLREENPERNITFVIAPGLTCRGDEHLLEIVLTNLLTNACKFTGKKEAARIEFGSTDDHNEPAFFIRDNGIGFDMAYAGKLFGAFQRMHKFSEFPGNGIGLATVKRIIHRHGGRVWADSQPDHGTTIFFTIKEETS